jgi:hypothetical protein
MAPTSLRHLACRGLCASLMLGMLPSLMSAEDVQLRQRAVELLEHASVVGTTPTRPPYEEVVSIHAFATPENAEGEGQVKMIWAAPGQRRIETDYGAFHLLNIWYQDQLIVNGRRGADTPPVVRRAMKFLPVHTVRFDHEDTIRAIDDAVIKGRPAHCIEFDTSYGAKVDNNEICVDRELGAMVRFRFGVETEEYSDFFSFAGATMPHRVEIFRNGAQTFEIHQTLAAIPEVPVSLFAPPPDSEIRTRCAQVRPAFGVSMPQPSEGSGRDAIDIVVQGMVGPDGKVYSTAIMTSDRPDLDSEALKTAAKWTYTPALCDGTPNWERMDLLIHFQGR